MIETLRDFVERVGQLGIEYMVTGSFAMSAYGEIRSTRDIDIVVKVSEKDAPTIAKSFGEDYYVSEESVRRAIVRRFDVQFDQTAVWRKDRLHRTR